MNRTVTLVSERQIRKKQIVQKSNFLLSVFFEIRENFSMCPVLPQFPYISAAIFSTIRNLRTRHAVVKKNTASCCLQYDNVRQIYLGYEQVGSI